MQTELANTFHSDLLPLREAVDYVKTDVLDSVHQQLMSVITQYRFAIKSKY